MEEEKKGLVVGFTHRRPLTDGRYMCREMGKNVGRHGTGRRLWGACGKFPGKCGLKDVQILSPQGQCKKMAWMSKVKGESHHSIFQERAVSLFHGWEAGNFDLGPEYDQYRGCVGGKAGDAWEGDEGDVGFDTEDFE
jgi:hypothetical protein